MERNEFLASIWQAYQAGGLLTACAWCGRVCIQEEWVAPPRGALSTIDEPMVLSHSICPACLATQRASPGQDGPPQEAERPALD